MKRLRTRSVLGPISFALSSAVLFSLPSRAAAAPTDIFISEYIEGSSNNKALELFNGTGAAINLAAGQYSVEFYANGAVTPNQTYSLTGSVANGDVYVFTNPSAALSGITSQSDQVATNATWYNGDDAVVLRKNAGGTIVDVLGQVGFDPGAEWGSGLVSTADNTLQRNASVCQGDTNPSDTFNPAAEWLGLAVDTTSGLGAHSIGVCGVVSCLATPATLVSIPDIQGAPGDVDYPDSPLLGEGVRVTGVVSAIFPNLGASGGFYIQRENVALDGAARAGASDGVFVQGSSAGRNVGDRVTLEGNVVEIDDAASSTVSSGSETAVELCTLISSASGAAPAARLLPMPVPAGLSPADHFEDFEGMLVALDTLVSDQMRVAQNFFLGRYGQMTLSSPDAAGVLGPVITPTQLELPGSPAEAALRAAQARQLIVLDDGQDQLATGDNPFTVPFIGCTNNAATSPTASVIRAGDLVTGVTGILDWGRINSSSGADAQFSYRIQPRSTVLGNPNAPTFLGGNPRSAPPNAEAGYEVVVYNVQNYFASLLANGTPPGQPEPRGAFDGRELARQTKKLSAALAALDADVVGLAELQNSPGVPGDVDRAVDMLVNGGLSDAVGGASPQPAEPVEGLNAHILANGGSVADIYAYVVSYDPSNSDAIQQGFLYKPATTELIDTGSNPASTAELMPTAPGGQSWRIPGLFTRSSLAQSFRIRASGEVFTAVMNHWKSKSSASGCSPDIGDGAGACNTQRQDMAEAVVAWVQSGAIGAGDPDFLLIGDMNAYTEESPIRTLTTTGPVLFEDLVRRDQGLETHDFIFDGKAGNLSHAFASQSFKAKISNAEGWRINADEPKALDYEEFFNQVGCYEEDAFRSADHDPVSLGISLNPAAVPVMGRFGLGFSALGLVALGGLAIYGRRSRRS